MKIRPMYTRVMNFPVTIVLPLPLVRETRLPRRLLIRDASQEIEATVVEWMREDPRYEKWLESKKTIESKATSVDEKTNAPRRRRGRPRKNATSKATNDK